jgi:hypothetical protein
MAQNVKTVMGVARASVKTFEGIAIASVKTIMGVDNTSGSAPTPELLWWKMTDGSGTTVTATVGPNGTTDASWVTGASGSGYALEFNGTSSDASSSSSVTYSVNKISISLWAYFDDTTSTRVLVENGNPYYTSVGGLIIFVDSGNLYVSCNGDSTNTVRSEYCAAPATGGWKHIVALIDGSTATANTDIYIDGSSQSTTVAVNTHSGTSNFATGTLYVGARGGSSLFLDGRIDDLRIYNRLLSGSEITAIYGDPQ